MAAVDTQSWPGPNHKSSADSARNGSKSSCKSAAKVSQRRFVERSLLVLEQGQGQGQGRQQRQQQEQQLQKNGFV